MLASADAHDGTVDHVVEDCAACSLHMKGRSEYATAADGYTLHGCSERCRKAIEEDLEEILAGIGTE